MTTESTAIVPAPVASLALVEAVASARAYASSSKAENTKRAYRTDWQAFAAWCDESGLPSLPASPATVATYASHLANEGRKVSSIGRALVAISQAHKMAGEASPTSSAVVHETVKGIRRAKGSAPTTKAPVLVEQLRAMMAHLPQGIAGRRDRALLSLGFAGAFRRSELVALDVSDLAFTADGLEVTIRRSKTDQEGQGEKIGVPYGGNPATCPVRAVRSWLDGSGIVEGAVFRSVDRWGNLSPARLTDRAVALVVKRYAEAVGLDPALFGGHSLRAGLATQAAKSGKAERAIMRQTRHRSVAMVRRYIRDADLFSDNAAAGIGL